MLLDKTIDSKNKVRVLRELSLHENWEYSVNELSKNTGIHRVRISTLIKELENNGVIKIKHKNKIKLISINKDNYFVKNILVELFKKEKNLAIEIVKEAANKIKSDKNIISILLFGSAIKKEFTFKSDIDIMIIYNKNINKNKIEKIIEFYNKKGLLISYDILDIKEFKNLLNKKEPSIISLIDNNKTIYGKNILEVV